MIYMKTIIRHFLSIFFVPDIVLRILHVLFHLFPTTSLRIDNIVILIALRRKLRLRELNKLATD